MVETWLTLQNPNPNPDRLGISGNFLGMKMVDIVGELVRTVNTLLIVGQNKLGQRLYKFVSVAHHHCKYCALWGLYLGLEGGGGGGGGSALLIVRPLRLGTLF